MSRIEVLKARLKLVELAIEEILKAGQEVSVSGAMSVRKAELEKLQEEEARLRKQLARLLGYSGKVRRVSDE